MRSKLPKPLIAYARIGVRHARMARVRLRMLDSRARVAPSFLIIGAMKAGTTSLFRYLLEHPQVAAPLAKEIYYFNFNWDRPRSWYLAHFPVRSAHAPGSVSGEASPGYLVHPRAPARVHSAFADMRIIVLMRDPVARSLSHYFHEARLGRETRPIDEALFAPEADTTFSLQPHEERAWYDAWNGTPSTRRRAAALLGRCPMHRAYLTPSRYADHLPAWFDQFDRDRILLLRSEDLFRDPAAQLARTLGFLELDAWTAGPLAAHNIGTYSSAVSPTTIDRLRARFAESDVRLRQLVGQTMTWDDA